MQESIRPGHNAITDTARRVVAPFSKSIKAGLLVESATNSTSSENLQKLEEAARLLKAVLQKSKKGKTPDAAVLLKEIQQIYERMDLNGASPEILSRIARNMREHADALCSVKSPAFSAAAVSAYAKSAEIFELQGDKIRAQKGKLEDASAAYRNAVRVLEKKAEVQVYGHNPTGVRETYAKIRGIYRKESEMYLDAARRATNQDSATGFLLSSRRCDALAEEAGRVSKGEKKE